MITLRTAWPTVRQVGHWAARRKPFRSWGRADRRATGYALSLEQFCSDSGCAIQVRCSSGRMW